MAEPNGHFRCYVPKKFTAESLKRIEQANAIIKEYEGQGLTLTLRQLYYQFVARGLLPNQKQSYDNLGSLISDGRLAGLVSWTAIEDRTRSLQGESFEENPQKALNNLANGYKRDLWEDQEYRPEVWIEKEALVGVIDQICSKLRVDFFACRGYNSQSEQWRAGRRFARYINKGQRPIIFHLGDHDPSGIDMTRDNEERLALFAGVRVTVVRLALNYPQIEELKPPPNPAKLTDARAKAYVARFGHESWELDALDPAYLSNLIETSVLRVRDAAKWSAAVAREVEEKRVIQQLADETDL